MFEEVQGMLANTRQQFIENVRDEFGHSMDERTFEEATNLVHQLENDYAEAENKMMQVESMLAEARAMI